MSTRATKSIGLAGAWRCTAWVTVGALIGMAGVVWGHNGEDPPGPPKVMVPLAQGVQIHPPRWSWIHWWETNRDRFLVPPHQDAPGQAATEQQVNAWRERAARILIEIVTGQQQVDEELAVQALMALGKMRFEPALPAIKGIVEKSSSPNVRSAGLMAIGLIGAPASEQTLMGIKSADVTDRVAAGVGLGLLPKLSDPTVEQLRVMLAGGIAPVTTTLCWALHQGAGENDNVAYYRSLLLTSPSTWVAAEAIVALGRDAESVPRLKTILLGTTGVTAECKAWAELDRLKGIKQRLQGAAMMGARGAMIAPSEFAAYMAALDAYYAYRPVRGGRVPLPSASRGLAEIGLEEILQAQLRASAAIALGQVDRAEARGALLEFLSNRAGLDEFLVMPQEMAIFSLATYPDDETLSRLIKILGRTNSDHQRILEVPADSPLRGCAALSIGMYARPYETPQGLTDRPRFEAALTSLAERLLDEHEDMETRTACAVALGLTGRTAVLPVLNKLSLQLRERNRIQDKMLAGYVFLGRALVGDTNLVEQVKWFLLANKDETTPSGIMARRAAVLALGVSRQQTAIPVLTQAWHLNYYVNREVIVAMRLIGAQGMAETLLENLKNSKDPQEIAYMANALGEILAPERPTKLVRLIAGTNYTVRNDWLTTLKRYPNDFMFGYLMQAFGDQWR